LRSVRDFQIRVGARDREAMTLYGEREGEVRPVLQIAMPRWPGVYAPGGTMHVVARCNNREFYFAGLEESEIGGRASVPSAAPSS